MGGFFELFWIVSLRTRIRCMPELASSQSATSPQENRPDESVRLVAFSYAGLPLLLLLLLAALPLVGFHFWNLWNTPYAKVFPIAYLGVAYYLYRDGISVNPPYGWRYRSACVSIPLAFCLGFTGIIVHSPYLGQVATTLLIFSIVVSYFDAIPFHRVAKLVLVLLIVALPSRLAIWMELKFESVVGRSLSSFLEYWNLPHLRSANQFEFPEISFHVIEDGHGMETFYLISITVALSWVFRNRGLLTSLLEVFLIPCLAIALFMVRGLIVLYGKMGLGVDFTKGSWDIVLSLAWVPIVIGVTWLALHGLRLVMREIPPPSNRDKTPLGAEVFNRISRWPWPSTVALTRAVKPKEASNDVQNLPGEHEVHRRGPLLFDNRWVRIMQPLTGLWLFVAVGLLIALARVGNDQPHSPWYSRAESLMRHQQPVFDERELPAHEFHLERRGMHHPLGEISQQRTIRFNDGSLLQASLSLGTEGTMRPLAHLKAMGWESDGNEVKTIDGPTPIWNMELKNQALNSFGYVLLRSPSDEPTLLEKDLPPAMNPWVQRFTESPLGRWLSPSRNDAPLRMHVMIMLISPNALSSPQKAELVEMMEKIGPKLLEYGMEAAK